MKNKEIIKSIVFFLSGLLISGLAFIAFGQMFPFRKIIMVTNTITTTSTVTISIIAEKVRCENAGGIFTVHSSDYCSIYVGNNAAIDEIGCQMPTPKALFDYNL